MIPVDPVSKLFPSRATCSHIGFENSQVMLGIFSAAEIKSMAYNISLHKAVDFCGN